MAEGIRVVEPTLPNEAFLVVAGTGTPAASWSPLASSAAGGPALAPAAPAADGFETLGAVLPTQGGTTIVGLPPAGLAVGMMGPGADKGSSPAWLSLPIGGSLNALTTDPADYVRVLGASAVAGSQWVYLVDSAVDGSSPTYETLVLSSGDGGRSWSVANNSGPLSQPQYP